MRKLFSIVSLVLMSLASKSQSKGDCPCTRPLIQPVLGASFSIYKSYPNLDAMFGLSMKEPVNTVILFGAKSYPTPAVTKEGQRRQKQETIFATSIMYKIWFREERYLLSPYVLFGVSQKYSEVGIRLNFRLWPNTTLGYIASMNKNNWGGGFNYLGAITKTCAKK